jgi:ribosome-associated protein
MRHTRAVASDDLRTERGLVIPADAIEWSFARAGGAGGQHVNTSSTKATLVVDLTRLQGPAAPRTRVLAALGDELRVTSQTHRSQVRNRDECVARVIERIDEAARPPAPQRRASRPTKGSVERRLEAKRRAGETKRGRRGDW